MKNGWGFVLHEPCGRCHYAHGEIPGALLDRFTSRRAFIYALEILAQIMCIVSGMALMEPLSLCFIDNEPGKFALQKGFGKDAKVNRLLGLLWRFVDG